MAEQQSGGPPASDGSATTAGGESPAGGQPTPFELHPSGGFASWLSQVGASLAVTTYQAGKLFLVGLRPDGGLSVFERSLPRCMGMAVHQNSLYVASLYQLLRFENALETGQLHEGYDRLYVPQLAYFTGDLDIHDLAVDGEGRVLFVNTLFGCIAFPSETHSFVPLWKPPFLERIAAEDCCHLNGVAVVDGKPRYATAVSQSAVADGWRDHRGDGGVVLGIEENEVLLRGLSMPHSPRFYRERLWLHNSGSGEFGYANLDQGRFEPVAFCPGYLRGLDFIGDYAVAGLSRTRENRTFSGLPLADRLAAEGAQDNCGVYVIDLRSGEVVHWLRIEGVVQELYDVVALPGVRRPMAIGFIGEEIQRTISIGERRPGQ